MKTKLANTKFIIAVLMFLTISSCEDNSYTLKAINGLQKELKADFDPYTNPNLGENRPKVEFDWCVSKSKWVSPSEIDSYKIIRLYNLTEYYQHHDYIMACINIDPNGHWPYPLIEDVTYLPDSIVDTYNRLSKLINSANFKRKDTVYFDSIREYVQKVPPPLFGYKAKAEICWHIDSTDYFNEVDIVFDTSFNVLSYTPECWNKLTEELISRVDSL